MMSKITLQDLDRFRNHLRRQERSPGTVENYLRYARAFASRLEGRRVTKELTAAWKEEMVARGHAPATRNPMPAAGNSPLVFLDRKDCRVKLLRIQRRLFRDPARELTGEEYRRLLDTARARGRERLALLMEAICATGIRVSEVKYLTVEAAKAGRTDVALKGKVRTILIPNKLCRKLLKYAKKNKTASGEIFLTRSGKSLSRRQIWCELKSLCSQAGVEPSKVFPHNLRHLFAATFYRVHRDIARLADVLGHSSVETTRVYLATSGMEHSRQLDQLGLVT